MANRNTNNVLAPQTAWELILVIVKKMPRQLLKTLPLTLLMGILGWLFNFWLMGWVNDGFNPSTWVSKNLIGVTGKMISATILWAMIGAIIPMMIHFIKSGGKVGHAIGDFFSQPAIIMAGIKKGTTRFNAILCFVLAGTLLVDNLLSGVATLVAGSLLLNSVVALVSGRGSVMVQLLRMIANDIQVYILKKPGLKMAEAEVGLIIGACGIAMVIIGLTRSVISVNALQIILNAVWLVFFIIGMILFFSDKPVPKQLVFVLLFWGSWLFLQQLEIAVVLADDSGAHETGGTLIQYIAGPAIPVMIRSLPPAIAIMIGAIIGGIVPSLSGIPGNQAPDWASLDPSISPKSEFGWGTNSENDADKSDLHKKWGSLDPSTSPKVEDGWDTVTEDDDYDTRLRKYINSLDPSDAKRMVDPLTGTEYLVKYDPYTQSSYELNSKRPFSMDQFKEAQKSAEGLADYRQRNAQLENEYQQQRRQEEADWRDRQEKLAKLNQLKDKMYKAAEGLDDPAEKDAMYARIASIRNMENKFHSGEGDLKLSQAARMYANAITGRTLGGGQMPEDDTLAQSLVDTLVMTGEEIARGDGIMVGVLQTAVIVAAATICLPAAIAVEASFIIAKAAYGMKDYVDEGGDSAIEGFLQVTTTAVKDEMWGWGFGAAVKGGKAGKDALKAGESLQQSARRAISAGGEELSDNLTKVPTWMKNRIKKVDIPEARTVRNDLADARTEVNNRVSKQKAAEIDVATRRNNASQYENQIKRNERLAKESNLEVNQREAARNRYNDQINQANEAAAVAKKKADALPEGAPKKAEYQKRAGEHAKNAESLKKQQTINEDLRRQAQHRAEAAKEAQAQAKDKLRQEKQAVADAQRNLNSAKKEVGNAKSEMDAIAASEFAKGSAKEVAKNTFEASETSDDIDTWRNEVISNLFK